MSMSIAPSSLPSSAARPGRVHRHLRNPRPRPRVCTRAGPRTGIIRHGKRDGSTNGEFMSKIRVAIAGVGNCSSSLVQGVEYYREASPDEAVPGLMHVHFGDYHVRDVDFVAAFAVDANDVGEDLAYAINASENNPIK